MSKAAEKLVEQIEEDVREGLPSASSMDADVRCLGRRALLRRVPKKKGSKYAEKGTRIHDVMDGKDPSKLSKSEQTTAYIIAGEEDRIMEKYGFLQGSEIIREKRYWAVNEFEEKMYSGQLDALYLQENKLAIADYKSGFMYTVPILRNFQIKTQMALAVIHHKPKTAIASIIHPFHPDSLSETMVFGETELNLLPGIISGYIEQMTEGAPRTPNGVSCHFCDAKDLCPEYNQVMAPLVAQAKSGAPVKARWEIMSPEEKGERLSMFQLAESIIKDERAAYKDLLKSDPDAVYGWKLGSTGSTSTITDQEAAKDLVREALGPDAADGTFEISHGTLKAHFISMGLSEKKAKEKADAILSPVTVYKPKEKKLVQI